MRRIVVPTPLLVAAAFATTTPAAAQVVDPSVPAARDTTPVVLSGKELGSWATPSNQTVQPPLMDFLDCPYSVNPDGFEDPTEEGANGITNGFEQNCPPDYDPHNHYADPAVDTSKVAAPSGVPVDRLLGYRWDAGAGRFVQIPFQVDEQFTRYLDNTASGFALYSGQDQHTTYAYDREGFRFTQDGPAGDPCRAQQATPTAADPVKGLDHNDEIAFMASDAGPQAPSGAKLPHGIEKSQVITVTDPQNADAPRRFVYVGLAAEDGPRPAFDASNGYVKYQRDANADDFAFSESSYDNYGNAATGYYCDENGEIVRNADGTPKEGRRRPRDGATITTGRYRYRYDGRWLMTRIEISEDGGSTYGPDLVDRWKARAFAQDPESETPCCGYEEEDNNWGGSSTLLGEKAGPVRVIRETWGADSGTNVIRRETFYREEMKQKTWLRVHVIPPLDGIYAQWDFNANQVDTFYNSNHRGEGVKVDGVNDEVYGNFDDPCNESYDGNTTGEIDQGYRNFYRQMQLCRFPYHLSADVPDLTFGNPNAGTDWSMVAGDNGSIVDRITTSLDGVTLGGAAQSVFAVPYYRDDACFDDGTGDDPGIDVGKRTDEEPRVRADGVTPRKCWNATRDKAAQTGTDEFYQGSIGTHGLHLLFLAESDNARQTVPVNEIVSEWQMVMLPGRHESDAGERYGRAFEKPLVTTATELGGPAADGPPSEEPPAEEPPAEEPPAEEPPAEAPKEEPKGQDKPKGEDKPKGTPAAQAAPSSSRPAAPRSAHPRLARPSRLSAAEQRRALAKRRAATRARCAAKARRLKKSRTARRKAQRRCVAAASRRQLRAR
jgi:hypothetical protein